MLGLDLIPNWRRGAAVLRTPVRALPYELDEYERGDFTRTRLLAWSVALWAASVSLFRPVEAVFFGIALFIIIYRLPASLRLVLSALRSPIAILMLVMLAITGLATIASPEPATWRDVLPKRLFLAPLLVLPVLHRWRLVLGGLAAGAVLQAIYSAIALELAGAFPAGDPPIPLDTANGASTTLVAGVVVGVSMALFVRASKSAVFLSAMAALCIFIVQTQSTMRAAVVGSIAGAAAVLACISRRARVAGAALILIGAGVAAVGATRGGGMERTYESLNQFSSNRLEMWRLTAIAVADQPIFGHGRNEWRAEIDRARDAAAGGPAGSELIWTDRRVGYSHNTPLDVLYESGVVGLAALVAAFWLVVRRLWSVRGIEPLFPCLVGLLTASIVVAQFDFVFQRAIPGALLMISCALAVAPSICRSMPSARAMSAR